MLLEMFWCFFFRENRCKVNFCFPPSLWSVGSILAEHCVMLLVLFSLLFLKNAKALWNLLFTNVIPKWKGEEAAKINEGEYVH